MADSYYNPNFSSLTNTAGSTAANAVSKTSSLGTVASIAVPLLLSLFGSKKASPQSAAQTTAQQNTTALASLPPEIKALLNIQTQNAQAAQPLYLNALNATNALLPMWARGGSVGTSSAPMTNTSSAPTIPASQTTGGGNVGSDLGEKTPAMGGSSIPLSGAAVDNNLVPGNSLNPQTVLAILGAITGNPALGAFGRFIKKPDGTSNTDFTMAK